MTFHTAIILLANGVLASKTRTTSPNSDDAILLDKKASCICYEAATNMCNVARSYRRIFGSFRQSAVSATHCLLSAALVLIRVTSNGLEDSRRKVAVANIELCLQSLQELSVSWRIAGKTHRSLALLKERKLGTESSARDSQPHIQTAVPASGVDGLSNPTLSDLPSWTGSTPANPILLNDAHFSLGSYFGDSNTTGGFDLTAQFVDIDFQNASLWGHFVSDFTSDPDL